ncbi:MAG TPA: helix-turn-helix domain-containing protein [Croceibacterium sp.]|nr:helix-turn-helix domain-containing protein [Croceibacterium sp.]
MSNAHPRGGKRHGSRITLTAPAGRTGLTLANVSILRTGTARAIRVSTLAAICRELECQPGQLLGSGRSADQGR